MNLPSGPIVYVMKGWGHPDKYKIGCTANVYRRYQSTRGRERIVRVLGIPEGANQYGAEAAVHEWFDRCRCIEAGETFWLSEEDLKELSEMQIKHCKRCNRQWCYRGTGEPLRCGKCKSPYWNIAESQGGEMVDTRPMRAVLGKSAESSKQTAVPRSAGSSPAPATIDDSGFVHDLEYCQEPNCRLCRKLRQGE